MDKNKIIDALTRSNKWWKEKFEVDFKARDIYNEIKKFIHTKQIISLTGLRRTGKTTIMLKIIQDSLPNLDKQNIVYFSFDEFKDVNLIDVIESYARLMNKDMNKEKYLFLFDEIQKIENWEEQLNRIYDEHKNIKFIISGSESLFIRKKSRESLAGRIYEFQVKTLNLKEYLIFKNKKFDNLRLYREDILKEFNNFLYCGGFPEIINENKEIVERYIKNNVIEKIIYRDIPQIFPIKEPEVLEQIFKIILEDPGEMINLDEFSNELGVSRQTVSLYLEYLEKSFLIKKIYNFSKNARKTQRKSKKYYPTILISAIIEKSEKFGKVFETSMVNQLDASFFWRDNYKNEVDIIKNPSSKLDKTPLPIEVKSGKFDTRSLKLFMKKFKVNRGIILTYDTKEKLGNIQVIPFYEFLLKK